MRNKEETETFQIASHKHNYRKWGTGSNLECNSVTSTAMKSGVGNDSLSPPKFFNRLQHNAFGVLTRCSEYNNRVSEH